MMHYTLYNPSPSTVTVASAALPHLRLQARRFSSPACTNMLASGEGSLQVRTFLLQALKSTLASVNTCLQV
jgi:hypothetical protein